MKFIDTINIKMIHTLFGTISQILDKTTLKNSLRNFLYVNNGRGT